MAPAKAVLTHQARFTIPHQAAETDATKRALATFGKPFGLELYRKDKRRTNTHPHCSQLLQIHHHSRASVGTSRRHDTNSAAVALLWAPKPGLHDELLRHDQAKPEERGPTAAPTLDHRGRVGSDENRQKPARDRRTQTIARQGTPEIRGFATVPGLRAATVRSASSSVAQPRALGLKVSDEFTVLAMPRSSSTTAPSWKRRGLGDDRSMHWRSQEGLWRNRILQRRNLHPHNVRSS